MRRAIWLWISLAASGACTSGPDVVAVAVGQSAGASGEGGAGEGIDGVGGRSAAGTTGDATDSDLEILELTGDLEVHDPSVIEGGGEYFLFHTGPRVPIKASADLLDWHDAGSAFADNPAWIADLVPNATSLWAPDVSWFNGTYHLYYAASTFGSGHSCIGHATQDVLDPSTPWIDRGPVICSNLGETEDDWDAIDPSTFEDREGNRWMAFGSFGSGIKMIPLDAKGERVGDELLSVARRPTEPPAIQAATIHVRPDGYYFFASFDWCCRGVESNNNLRMGRAAAPTGPYLDRDGIPLLEGGGTLLLEGNERWHGVGANTILATRGRDYNVYHSYDADAFGRASLRIAELDWNSEGWPVSGGP